MDFEQAYHATRQAWIDGVKEFHPAPKESYLLHWDAMETWEKEAVKSLFHEVRSIILPGLQQRISIPPEHGGHLVCSIWNVLMFQLLHNPKPSYVKHFHELDEWQQQTDIKMFEAIESAVRREVAEHSNN